MRSSDRGDIAIPNLLALPVRYPALVLAAAQLGLHIWCNGHYGVFRDELYFIACGWRPDWGYVDQPPLMPLIAASSWHIFTGSLRGLRVVPALAGAATVALTVRAAGELGGGLYARWLAGLCVMAAGVLQVFSVLLVTDTLQPLLWTALTLALMPALSGRNGWWWGVGALAGLAFLTKYMVLFQVASLGLGILAMPQRRVLGTHGPWLAALLALAIAAPNLAWQAAHGFPFLELGANAMAGKNIVLSPPAFLREQVLSLNPVTAPVWAAGLIALLTQRAFAGLRWIALGWVALMAMMLMIHAKPYYPAACYPMLMAAGAVALEAWLRPRPLRAAVVGTVIVGGVGLAPLFLPVLPVERFIAYQHALGLEPSTGENRALGTLPQYYADMFGWHALAAKVAQAYAALPAQERAQAVFFAGNYGEAAAVEVLDAGTVPVISAHNNYFLWGPGRYDGSVVLLLARPDRVPIGKFDSCSPVGITNAAYAMPDETGKLLLVCRNRHRLPPVSWPALKHYD
ncbi:ArnT family glycosyltransferase [Rhodopila globiformis]|nr:glycosyltransferase family 39 protein [Rhodopila globiformis]